MLWFCFAHHPALLYSMLLQWKTILYFILWVCSMQNICLYLALLEFFLQKPCLQSYWMNIERAFWKLGWGVTKQRWPTKWKLSSCQQGNRHLSDTPPSGRLIHSCHEQPSPPKVYLSSLLSLSSLHYQCLYQNNHPHISHLKVTVNSSTKMLSPHNLPEEITSPASISSSSSSFSSWLDYLFWTSNPMIPLTWTLPSHLISLLTSL